MVVNELNIFKRLYNPTLIQVLSVGENIWPIMYKSISIKNNIFIKGTDIIFSLMTWVVSKKKKWTTTSKISWHCHLCLAVHLPFFHQQLLPLSPRCRRSAMLYVFFIEGHLYLSSLVCCTRDSSCHPKHQRNDWQVQWSGTTLPHSTAL